MCLFPDWTQMQNRHQERVIPEDRLANMGRGDRSAQAFGFECNAKRSLARGKPDASDPGHAGN